MNPWNVNAPTTVRGEDLHAWTAAVEESRREYELHPIAACHTRDCDRLATKTHCIRCTRELNAAAKRMRNHRKEGA